jgi:hypothetical protein
VKKILFIMFVFLGAAVLYAQDEGNAAVLQDIPKVPDLFLLNTALDVGFGNMTGEDYGFFGEKGKGYIKPGFDVVKAFGSFVLVGQLYDTIALSYPVSYNALEIKLIPLLFVPQTNILVGAQFSGYFPFHEGRLIADIPQAPQDSFLTNIATLEIIPAVQYTQPLSFGSLYQNFLFIADKPVASNDWTLQGDLEVGIKTGLGISAHVSPVFTFLSMGEAPDPGYTAMELQFGYTKNPISAGLTLTLPGAYEDAFKNYGVNISTKFQYTFKSNLEVWGSLELRGVGNGVDQNVAVVPALGTKYYIPLMNYLSPASGAAETGEESPPPVPAGSSGAAAASPEKSHWYIGFIGGYANNNLYTSTGGRTLTEYEKGHGVEFGIPVRYQVNPWFAVQTELQYIQKNYTWRRTGQYDRVYSTITNSFIDIPLLANFSLGGEKLRVFANAGGYAGVWIDSRRKGTQRENTVDAFNPSAIFYSDYDERVEFDNRRDARFEAGLLAGLGLQYALNTCTFFLEGRYYYGLTDLQQDYAYNMVSRMNSTFAVTVGAVFNYNLIKKIGGKK